jgi:hypothetical protein
MLYLRLCSVSSLPLNEFITGIAPRRYKQYISIYGNHYLISRCRAAAPRASSFFPPGGCCLNKRYKKTQADSPLAFAFLVYKVCGVYYVYTVYIMCPLLWPVSCPTRCPQNETLLSTGLFHVQQLNYSSRNVPPSARTEAPLIAAAQGLHRYAATLAISSGEINRCSKPFGLVCCTIAAFI